MEPRDEFDVTLEVVTGVLLVMAILLAGAFFIHAIREVI